MAEETKVKRVPPQKGKPKHRSPNYPVVSLRKAVERIQVLYDQYKRHWVPIGVAHVKWTFKAHSGVGNQVVAALRAYGLLDVQGDGDERQIKLSERGYHIIEGHRDRPELLKAAALNPGLHAELWKMHPQGLPPDDVLAHYLKFNRNFNPDAVDGFIARLRETITFAGLNSSDKIGAPVAGCAGEDEVDDDDAGDEMDVSGDEGKRAEKIQPPPAGTIQDVYTAHTGAVVVRWPNVLTAEEYEDLETWLDMIKRKIKRAVSEN